MPPGPLGVPYMPTVLPCVNPRHILEGRGHIHGTPTQDSHGGAHFFGAARAAVPESRLINNSVRPVNVAARAESGRDGLGATLPMEFRGSIMYYLKSF